MRLLGRRTDDHRRDGDQPVATYAAVLDGVHLWWHVEGHDALVLRDRDRGTEVTLDHDVADLTTALGTASGTASGTHHDALAGGRPVAWAGLDRTPSRAPLAPDGVTGWDVGAEDGHLVVVRRRVDPTAVLLAVERREDRIHLSIHLSMHLGVRAEAPVAPGTGLLLLDPDDRPLAVLPVTAHEADGADGAGTRIEALVAVEDLPTGHVGVLRVAVGTPDDWRRVRRSRTDLVDPHHASLLPELPGLPGTRHADRTRVRLRWSADSLLALRMLDPDEDPA